MGRHRELRLSHATVVRRVFSITKRHSIDDSFRRVFEFINPFALNRCFLPWVETLVGSMGGEIIPIDGKTIRGSYDRNLFQSALDVISAWASEHRLVLAQVKVEDKP